MTLPAPTIIERAGSLWVVAKPAGWLVHPATGTNAPDLVTWCREQGAGEGTAPVHRLDRETSGVILLSDDGDERGALGAAFARGEVAKTYVALVYGRVRRKGIVRRPLDDARRGRPLEAVTRYRLREHIGAFSLISARPEHGRKHQIRRHLQMIDHAVVGDTRYLPRRRIHVPSPPGRLWLHAERLVMQDGRTWSAPLAEELAAHLEVLREGAATRRDD